MMVHDSLVICCMDTCPNQGIGEVSFPNILPPKEGGEGGFFAQIRYFRFEGCELRTEAL